MFSEEATEAALKEPRIVVREEIEVACGLGARGGEWLEWKCQVTIHWRGPGGCGHSVLADLATLGTDKAKARDGRDWRGYFDSTRHRTLGRNTKDEDDYDDNCTLTLTFQSH